MALTLKQLGYFVALAEEGSFGRAAQRVRISQPALSVQVRELEGALGVRLVERLPREVRLTRAGRDTLLRARAILSQVSDLEQATRRQHGLSGHLTLGIIPTAAPYILPPLLTRLRAHDVTLDIRVREAQTASLIEALGQGRLDAAVVALPVPERNIAAIPLFEDRFVLAGSSARIEALSEAAAQLRPSHLAPDQILLLDEGHCLADQALEVCHLARRGRMDLGASSLATLCGLVAEGLGLTLLPETALPTETAAAPGLAVRRFSPPEPARTLALVHRAGAGTAWVDDLAAMLSDAGRAVLDEARHLAPPPLDNAPPTG
ncbi:hydrogen peroxide-inducible genes activator [Roseitranquillus sediminis]|uniref:hydrogen peroxide-inducible genes activator n=1 Tax=Roseitranquillus sediminis TaxID=2809051 RepID=UPI001D0C0EED|nr:hydrogen peroxide-inducible genes activator [Roseitranquillus sediminis]MBM9595541.1 LysR family transcriptional regulator [Roseitranquillus sediminis]